MPQNKEESSKHEDAEPASESDEAARRFVEDLVTRGDAAHPDKSGKLPPGATHEIVEDSKNKPPKVKRRRFSAY